MKEKNLIDLETILPNFEVSLFFTNFLIRIRELHRMCVAQQLELYAEVLSDFIEKFFPLFENFGLNMTLKIHAIVHHYEYFLTGLEPHPDTNGEFTESCHITLRKSEETHGLK